MQRSVPQGVGKGWRQPPQVRNRRRRIDDKTVTRCLVQTFRAVQVDAAAHRIKPGNMTDLAG